MEVIEGKKRKKRGKIILIIVVLAFLLYAAISTISQQIQISQKRTQLASIQTAISEQTSKNEALRAALDSGVAKSSESMERSARKNLNYALPGEMIFVNISGN